MRDEPKPATGHMPFKGHRTQKEVRLDERTCLDCGCTISRYSTGRCRVCAIHHRNATDPTIKARRTAAVLHKMATDPVYLAKLCRVRRENGQLTIRWCPSAYRAEYHRLRTTKRMLAREARALIEDQINRDMRGLDPLARAIKLAGLRA